MELITAFWDGDRWHEAGEKCPPGREAAARAQGALPAENQPPVDPVDTKTDDEKTAKTVPNKTEVSKA